MIIAQMTVDPATDTPVLASVFGFDLATFTVGLPGMAWTCEYTSQAAAPDASRNCVVSVDEAALLGIEVPGFLTVPGASFATMDILTGALAQSAGLVRLTCWRIPVL